MGTPKLPTPELRIWMVDGSYHEVQALNADLVSYDRDRAKQKWPGPADAPMLWLTYIAWHHLVKTRQVLPQMTLREFEEQCAAVSSADEETDDDDEEGGPGADPTREGHALE